MGEHPALSETDIEIIALQRGTYTERFPQSVPSPELLDWLTI